MGRCEGGTTRWRRRRGRAAAIGFCLLALACLRLVSCQALTDEDYAELLSRHRVLAGAPPPAAPDDPCKDKIRNQLIPGQYLVVFDSRKVGDVYEGVASLEAAFTRASTTRAQQPAAALPFSVVGAVSSISPGPPSATRGMRRRLHAAGRDSPVLGVVVRVAPASAPRIVKTLDDTASVKLVQQDFCVGVAGSRTFTCLPATMLSSMTLEPVASATWPVSGEACLPSATTKLAWWGHRCGTNLTQVEWQGVYAYNAATGERNPSCVLSRPAAGSVLTPELKAWLGECGVAPTVVVEVPTRTCGDFYPETSGVAGTCFAPNFTAASQTVSILHPLPACGGGKPVEMTFSGTSCTSNGGAPDPASTQLGVLWTSAVPADAALPATCRLDRAAGSSREAVDFNRDWFGSCGVPPTKVQFLSRGQCGAQPPPPPPEDAKVLQRVPVVTNGNPVIPPGMKRIMAVVQDKAGAWITVTPLEEVAVAVFDTGIDCRHSELNVVYNKSFVKALNNSDDANGCSDTNGHGTNVAGIVGARNNDKGVIGVLPDVPLVAIKTLSGLGFGTYTSVAEALTWLMQTSLDGTTPNPGGVSNAVALKVMVVNMSLSWGNLAVETTCGLITQLINELGISFVAAAGNDNTPMNEVMPSLCEGVVAVTALNQGTTGAIDDTQEPASFSNYLALSSPYAPGKRNMTFSAPGVEILSTCPGGDYCRYSGTSQACPHIAGIFARCYSANRCTRALKAANVPLVARRFERWNVDNPTYGYAKDPIRSPTTSGRYYGYLSWADAW